MIRQIDMKRCYGYVSVANCVKIGAGLVIKVRFLPPEPKVFSTARVGFVDNFPDKGTFALAGY
jgi:hypothetical protein